jgi:hypothetical protein
MRPRPERVLGFLLLLAVALWAGRPALRAARWTVLGLLALARIGPTAPLSAPAPPARIAHGGGALGPLHTSNTLEALDRNYARGVRWFEMDFLPDRKGAWWAVHDWPQATAMLGVPLDRERHADPAAQRPGANPCVTRL